MKLSVIALDYDGTIARDDVLDPAVRDAIALVRTHGIIVLLVTGRILDGLRRVVGELHVFDGVVAENGAVLHLPGSGHTATLGPGVPRAFLDALAREGIPHHAGQCLVDLDASHSPGVLHLIRALELPLVLIFNHGRAMVMPQGISKATGLQTALDTLRLSARNTLAIGDAENDHELLRLAEVGAAVEWGSAALRLTADITIRGTGPQAVATYLRNLAETGRLPIPDRPRRRLLLGHTEDGRELSLAVRGRNVLVAGDAKSGKSWVAGLLCEQLILHGYSICVIDPEGDYVALEGMPGVTVFGGEDPLPSPRDLLRALRYPDRSLVIDLSRQPHEQKVLYVRSLLPALAVLRQRTGLPHRIVLDEAHYFMQESAARLLDPEANGYTLVTYHPSALPDELLAATEVMIVTCESNPVEIEALRRWCARCAEIDPARWSLVGRIRRGQAVALPITEETGGDLRLFAIGPRVTPHVRHREKYVDVPVREDHAFVFAANDGQREVHTRTLREFVHALDATPPAALDAYLWRGDFSRWMADVFGDRALAAELRALEAAHRAVRRRDTVAVMADAIRGRYDLLDEDSPVDAPVPVPA